MVKACMCSLPNSRVYISVSCSLIQSVHHYCKERLDMGKVKKSSTNFIGLYVLHQQIRILWVSLILIQGLVLCN